MTEDPRLIVDAAAYTLGAKPLGGAFKKLVEHVGARTSIIAQTGDILALANGIDPKYLDYVAAMTGQKPDVIQTQVKGGTFHTLDLLEPFRMGEPNYSPDHRLWGYNQHHELAEWGIQNGIHMAETPAELLVDQDPLMETIASKGYFRRFMATTGQMLPQHISNIEDQSTIAQTVREIMDNIKNYGGVYTQLSRAGGGLGNLDIKRLHEGTYNSGVLGAISNDEDLYTAILEWVQSGRNMTGSKEIITTPLMDGGDFIESPTINAYVPKQGEGDPVIWGQYGQIVHPVTRAYEGFIYPHVNESDITQTELFRRSMKWFKHLQSVGYVGHADVDWLICNYQGDQIATPSESNVRMNAYRFMMQIAAINRGWNLRDLRDIDPSNAPNLIASDHVHTGVNSFDAVYGRIHEAGLPIFGITNSKSGIVIPIPPLNGQCGLGVIAESPNMARRLFDNASQLIS